MKKCVYCMIQLEDKSVVDVCRRCGHGVWGEKMFKAIEDNMGREKQKGNID
jgi:hypothetical protein